MNVFSPNSVTQYHFKTNYDLLQLSPKEKTAIYLQANREFDSGLVDRFREALGVKSDGKITLCPAQGPSILSPFMDIVVAKGKIEELFASLRTKGLLFTKSEFSKLDSSRYVDEDREIDRILRGNYVAQRIQILGLNSLFIK